MRNLDLALYTMQIWREAATNENKILKILTSRDTMVDGTVQYITVHNFGAP